MADLDMSPLVIQLFRMIEIVFYLLSAALTAASLVMIAYQLGVLFVPYWMHCLAGRTTEYQFPQYFYRVYGDDVGSLTYEHYGYLISAVVVTALVSKNVLPNHPWVVGAVGTEPQARQKID